MEIVVQFTPITSIDIFVNSSRDPSRESYFPHRVNKHTTRIGED